MFLERKKIAQNHVMPRCRTCVPCGHAVTFQASGIFPDIASSSLRCSVSQARARFYVQIMWRKRTCWMPYCESLWPLLGYCLSNLPGFLHDFCWIYLIFHKLAFLSLSLFFFLHRHSSLTRQISLHLLLPIAICAQWHQLPPLAFQQRLRLC